MFDNLSQLECLRRNSSPPSGLLARPGNADQTSSSAKFAGNHRHTCCVFTPQCQLLPYITNHMALQLVGTCKAFLQVLQYLFICSYHRPKTSSHILRFAQRGFEGQLLVIHLMKPLSSLANLMLPSLEAMHKTINLLSNLQLQELFHC